MTGRHGQAGRRAAAASAGILAAAVLGGCSAEYPPITGCEPAGELTPDCRFHNPEDLVVSPSGGFLLVSQMGAMDGSSPGTLVAYDPAAGTIETLFPLPDADPAPGGDRWGDPDCQPPETFSPHGIDIERLNDGRHALYAVNHGGRESVEMFEVMENEGIRDQEIAPTESEVAPTESEVAPTESEIAPTEGEIAPTKTVELAWRGCVVAPEDGNFNDLVILRNGDFWVSQMFPRGANVLWTALRMRFTGHTPGHVYHWSAGNDFQQIPGTETAFANGVEKSADEHFLFVNSYFGNAVNKVAVATGERLGSASVSSPDNLAWSPGGELLAASHHAAIPDLLACQELERGSCGFRFQIVAIDPQSMQTRVLLDHGGPPMGAATVAVPFGNSVYLGTFAGDRITRAPAAMLARPGG